MLQFVVLSRLCVFAVRAYLGIYRSIYVVVIVSWCCSLLLLHVVVSCVVGFSLCLCVVVVVVVCLVRIVDVLFLFMRLRVPSCIVWRCLSCSLVCCCVMFNIRSHFVYVCLCAADVLLFVWFL